MSSKLPHPFRRTLYSCGGKLTSSVAAAFLALVLASGEAKAVDNSIHTIGVGAISQFSMSGGPTQLSIKRALTPVFEAQILFGFGASSAGADFLPGLKLAYVLLSEERMNLYLGLGMAVDLRTASGLAGFLYQVGPGVEVFTPYWPNLGFSLEFGFGGATGPFTKGSRDFTTSFEPLGIAGVHYYF